jgi:hypothetical protein
MAGYKLNIQGLDELKKEFSKGTLDTKLTPAIGLSILQLHNALSSAIVKNYTTRQRLSSVLVRKSISQVKQGTNFISSGLEYKYKPVRLVEFLTNTFTGNINPASKEGIVSVVTIKRGQPRIVFGKKHYGGFLQRRGQRVAKAQIFERKQKATWANGKRLPIIPLYAPSLSQMASKMYDTDSEVQKVKDSLITTLAKFID